MGHFGSKHDTKPFKNISSYCNFFLQVVVTVVVTRVEWLYYAERQWIAHCRWLPLSTAHVLPNGFASVLKKKHDLTLPLMLPEGKMSAASRGVIRFSPEPLLLEINRKISAKMGAFQVFFSLWSLFKYLNVYNALITYIVVFGRVHRIIWRNMQPNNYYCFDTKDAQSWKFAVFSNSNLTKTEDGDKRFADSFSAHENL